MTKRRILNVTSTKKQDNMMPWTQFGDGSAQLIGPTTVPSAGGGVYIFSPTARVFDATGNSAMARNSQTCFVRGFKERISMRMSDGAGWRWRRIVFACKGLPYTTTGRINLDTSAGYARVMTSIRGSTFLPNITEVLFKGRVDIDWQNFFTAKVDTQRVTVISDKTRTIGNGNTSPRYIKHSEWYPINKNIVYGDDEAGGAMTNNIYSTTAKPGIGDIFIMDFFDCADGTANAHSLVVDPECTYYWHEK